MGNRTAYSLPPEIKNQLRALTKFATRVSKRKVSEAEVIRRLIADAAKYLPPEQPTAPGLADNQRAASGPAQPAN